MYWIAGGLFAAVGVAGLKLLPSLGHQQKVGLTAEQTASAEAKGMSSGREQSPEYSCKKYSRKLIFCLLALSLLWCVNNAYLISLPLHLGRNLAIGTGWVGWIMGTCALLEIPVMLVAGHLAANVNPLYMIRLAGGAALLLYAGVLASSHLWQLFTLQIFNAFFVGVVAGLGVSVVQTLLPGRSGSASALYTNTTHVGTLLASAQVGLVADLFDYQSVFVVNLVIVLAALLALTEVRGREHFSNSHARGG